MPSNLSLHNRVSLHLALAAVAISWAVLSPTGAVASGLSWGDEIAVDPGTRAPSMHVGFRNRIELNVDSDRERIIATWSERSQTNRGSEVYFLDPDGRSMNPFTRTQRDSEFQPIQVFRRADGSWLALEAGFDTGLRVSLRHGLEDETIGHIELEPISSGEIDARSVRMGICATGWWVAWRNVAGSVRMARILPGFELDGKIVSLAESARAMDIEFGEDGGVIGWSDERGWFYITLDVDATLLHEPRFVEDFPSSHSSQLFRINNRVFFIQYTGSQGQDGLYRLRGFDLQGTPRLERTVFGHRTSTFDVVSAPGGAALVGSGLVSAVLLGYDGQQIADVIDLGTAVDDSSVPVETTFDAVFLGDRYFIAWSNDRQETLARNGALIGDECHLANWVNCRTVTTWGEVGELQVLNATYKPLQSQPWFSGDELHLVMQDEYSNRLQHVVVDDVGAPSLVEEIGGLRPCKADLRIRTGYRSGSELYVGRFETRYGDFDEDDRSLFRICRLGTGSPADDRHAPGGTGPGGSWSIAELDGAIWIVTDHRLYSPESRFSDIGKVDSDFRLDIQPAPTDATTKLIILDGRLFVVWEHGDTLFGGYVPASDDQPIEPLVLSEQPGLGLESATEGEAGALIVFRSNGELLVLALFADGTTLGPPRALGSGHGAHVAWNGARYLVSWLDGPYSEWTVKVARVTGSGAVLDFGGESIGATKEYVPPLVAAASPENGAVTYGGNRLRRLSDTTRLDARGPFTRSLPTGIEIAWEIGEANVARLAVERARVDQPGEAGPFVVVQGESELATSSYLDENVEPGILYSYRLRIDEESGNQTVLGPVAALWPGNGSASAMAFTLRPNPSSGAIALVVPPGSPLPDRLTVFDTLGRVRVQVSREDLPSFEHGVGDLSPWCASLPSGMYWVRASRGSETMTRTLSLIR